MKKIIALGIVAAGLVVGASPVDAAHERGDLTVGLNGANEVGTQGDKNGSGKITLEFFAAVDNPDVVFPGEAYVCYDLTTRKVDPLVGLHIHEVDEGAKNPRKAAGPVVVTLLSENSVEADGSTCVATTSEILDGILDDPSEYYVNAHTAALPGGAIRGQLHSFS